MTDATDRSIVLTLRAAARSLTASTKVRDLDSTLDELVRAAADTVPHADGAGVTLTGTDAVHAAHATDDAVRRLDELQAALREGPCVTAADDPPETGIVVAHDLAGDDGDRWPSFAPAAVSEGYRSLLAVQLSFGPHPRSALNLYGRAPFAFDESDCSTAGLFGIQAAMLLHGNGYATNLDRALATRDVIGQAKGILMERFSVDESDAFRMLSTTSQDTNMKLIDVARWLTTEAGSRDASA